MIKCELNDNILTIIETQFSWIEDKTYYWYYDIVNWKKSITGKKNAKIEQNCSENDISWCKKYYFPKIIG